MKLRPSLALALSLLSAFAAVAEEAKPVDNTPKLALGLLMKQQDKLVFAPCRDRSYAIVDDVSTGAGVTKALESIGLNAGKKFYVEILGVMEGVTLKAYQLNFAKIEGRCQAPGGSEESWRAAGNEPAWNLVVGSEKLFIQRKGKADVVVPVPSVRLEGNLATAETAKDGHKVALRFERAVCRDKAADVLLGWSASVTVDGEALKGCAWQR